MWIFLSLNQKRIGGKSVLGDILLVEDLYSTYLCVKELIVCVSDLHFYSRRNFTHGRLKFFENYQLIYTLAQKNTFLKRVWICAVFWFLFWQNWIVKWNCQIGTGSGYISMCLILICSTVSNFEFTFWKQKKRQRDRYFHFRWKKIISHSFQRVHNTFFIVEFLHLLVWYYLCRFFIFYFSN